MSPWLVDKKALFKFVEYNIRLKNEKHNLRSFKILSTYDNKINIRLYYYNSEKSIYISFSDKELLLIDFIFLIRKYKLEKLNEYLDRK